MEEAVRAALSDLSSRDYLAPFHLHRFLHVLTVLFVYFVDSRARCVANLETTTNYETLHCFDFVCDVGCAECRCILYLIFPPVAIRGCLVFNFWGVHG